MKINNIAYTILLVEDNPGDIRLTQEAFKEARNDILLEVVTDGEQAIQFLKKEGVYTQKKAPDLILLDLNLPKVSGKEVLRQVKTDIHLKHIPIVVLSTSNAERDIISCYKLHANCFVTKSIDFNIFFNAIKKISHFWLRDFVLHQETEY